MLHCEAITSHTYLTLSVLLWDLSRTLDGNMAGLNELDCQPGIWTRFRDIDSNFNRGAAASCAVGAKHSKRGADFSGKRAPICAQKLGFPSHRLHVPES